MTEQTPLEFANASNYPQRHTEVREKIISLATEMHALYRDHMRQSTGKTCDICGHGDHSEHRRVKDIISGYEHRENDSPCLCFNHAAGWSMSLNSIRYDQPSDERVDLHFTQFLARHLIKMAAKSGKNSWPTRSK